MSAVDTVDKNAFVVFKVFAVTESSFICILILYHCNVSKNSCWLNDAQ